MATGIKKLVFVYNATSGTVNALLDSAHKIVSPSTYQCRLCDLTHDTFKEKVEWARFRESVLSTSNLQEIEFLHTDKFEKQYKSKWLPKYEYPLILEVSDYGMELFMSNIEINQINTTGDLIEKITYKLDTL